MEIARSLRLSAQFVGLVFVIGVVGFSIVGGDQHTVLDAVYMTVITLTTVGYTEIIDLTGSPGGRVFTTLLLLVGVGAFLYFFSNVTAFFVEGRIHRILWVRRMNKSIKSLNQHVIVCGGGNTGEHIMKELIETQRAFVLVDDNTDRIAELSDLFGYEIPTVVGDATDDEALINAGIERAAGIVACLNNDKDNLIVTVSARILKSDLRIVCRCIDEKVEGKIKKAGADAVVSPNRIGGLRLISELVRPTAVSYLDLMLRDREKSLRIESTEIQEGSPLMKNIMGDIRTRSIEDLLILALEVGDGNWVFNPRDSHKLHAGNRLIYMGGPSAREEIQRLAVAQF